MQKDKHLCKTCKTCVRGDQLLLLPDYTTIEIQNVAIGDVILGFNTSKKIFTPTTVLDIIKTKNIHVCEFIYDGQKLYISENHKILTSNYDWIKIKKSLGNTLLHVGEDGELDTKKQIATMRYLSEPTTVYSLDTTVNSYIVQNLVIRGIM